MSALRQRLTTAEDGVGAVGTDDEGGGREVAAENGVLGEGRRHERLRRDDEAVDRSAAAAEHATQARAGVLRRVQAALANGDAGRFRDVGSEERRLFSERERGVVNVVEVVAVEHALVGVVVRERAVGVMEDEEIGGHARVVAVATQRTDIALDGGVAGNEEDSELEQAERRIVLGGGGLRAHGLDNGLVGDVLVVEEVETENALLSAQRADEVVSLPVETGGGRLLFGLRDVHSELAALSVVDGDAGNLGGGEKGEDGEESVMGEGEEVQVVEEDGGECGEEEEGGEEGEVESVARGLRDVFYARLVMNRWGGDGWWGLWRVNE